MKILKENWLDGKDSAAADNIRINELDLHLYYDDYGAYPFAWFDNKCYVGDESSMHSSPTQKYIQDCVRKEIEKYGLDAECEGTFEIDGEDYKLGEYNENDEEPHLVDYVYYNIGNDEKYGKYCKGEITWKDGESWEFDEDWDNVYDKLVQMCDGNDDIAWEIWRNIERDNGFETTIGKKINIDEEPDEEDIDLSPYLEAEYTPSTQEMDNYLQSMYDAGRFWTYEKVICFWGNIGSNELGSVLEELGQAADVDFSDYRIVYEDEENDYKPMCCSVQEYMKGNQEHEDDDTHKDGFVNHLGRPRDKWLQTQDFRNFRGEVQGKKLGNMPMAKYHNLIYSENRKMNNIDRIINENINKFLTEDIDEYINSRISIPKVRGGWTEKKILKYLKQHSSHSCFISAIKEIADFDNAQDLAKHLYWHGSQYTQSKLSPSITKSEKWAEQYGGGGYGDRYYGISLTNIKKVATNFAMNARPSVHFVLVHKDAVIKNMEGIYTDSYDINEVIVDLYTEGVDGVYIGGGEGELVIINPRAITNITEAVQYFDLTPRGREYGNPSHDNPTDDEVQELLDMCKEYVEYCKTNGSIPNIPKMPEERCKNYDWYNYDKKLERYNKYKEDPSEIDNAIKAHTDKRKAIIQKMKFNHNEKH